MLLRFHSTHCKGTSHQFLFSIISLNLTLQNSSDHCTVAQYQVTTFCLVLGTRISYVECFRDEITTLSPTGVRQEPAGTLPFTL